MANDHVSAFLGEFFRRAGMKRAVRRAEAVLLWPQVAGLDLSRFTSARVLRDGVLYVDVSDGETAMHLNLQRQRFLDVYHARFHQHGVKEVRFRIGRVDVVDDAPAPPPTVPPDPAAVAALARSIGSLNLPDDVTAAAMRAGNAMLGYRARRVADGWVACGTCGALSPNPDLCDACRRYASDPRVVASVTRIATAPGMPIPELSDEERAVADKLAGQSLDQALAGLLPQALADPRLKAQLEQVARCRAALACGKRSEDIDEADLQVLDTRVLRVLGVL